MVIDEYVLSKWLLVIWIFFIVLFLVSAYRILNIMLGILKAVLKEYEDEEEQKTNRVTPERSEAFKGKKKK